MRVIVTGGGTGGHIYPAIAIADKFKEMDPETEILYVGNDEGIEKDIVPKSVLDSEHVAIYILHANRLTCIIYTDVDNTSLAVVEESHDLFLNVEFASQFALKLYAVGFCHKCFLVPFLRPARNFACKGTKIF